MSYSDYIVYVDESGDHNLVNDDPNYPMFVLAFCIFRKTEYTQSVSPAIQTFKFKHFGHDAVVLHEHEIRKQQHPFVFLQSRDKREVFMNDLNQLIVDAPMTIIAVAIDKAGHRRKYVSPENPYTLALRFCVERLHRFLCDRGQSEKVTHIIVERRGKTEDRDLELEFRRIRDGRNYSNAIFTTMEMIFTDKKANSGGLQLADLIARPIGIKRLRPDQVNRAYDIIATKFHRGENGRFESVGLKCFP